MAEALTVSQRTTRGTSNARRQRAEGTVPAILYGHGKESISLSVSEAELAAAVRHGARLVDLGGALSEQALIREIQWDTYGLQILHVDFTRISAGERITVSVAVELRGVAPGTREGGVVEHMMHEVELECAAIAIPEKIQVNINELELGESILASQLEIPTDANILDSPDAVVVQCVEPMPEEELDEGDIGAAEPEVIGRKDEDGEEGEST